MGVSSPGAALRTSLLAAAVLQHLVAEAVTIDSSSAVAAAFYVLAAEDAQLDHQLGGLTARRDVGGMLGGSGLFSNLGCARALGADAAVSACESTALALVNEDAAPPLAMACDAAVGGLCFIGVIGLAADSIRSPSATAKSRAPLAAARSREPSAAARSRVPSASARSRTPAADAASAPIASAAVSGRSSHSAEDAHLARDAFMVESSLATWLAANWLVVWAGLFCMVVLLTPAPQQGGQAPQQDTRRGLQQGGPSMVAPDAVQERALRLQREEQLRVAAKREKQLQLEIQRLQKQERERARQQQAASDRTPVVLMAAPTAPEASAHMRPSELRRMTSDWAPLVIGTRSF